MTNRARGDEVGTDAQCAVSAAPGEPEGTVDLSTFSAKSYDRGASAVKEFAWLVVQKLFFEFPPFPLYGIRRSLLRLFGAKVGRGVVIKPGVRITFPWKLELGNNVWLGEDCWLLNAGRITIGDNVCISQRAMLVAGGHDHSSPTFDVFTSPIVVERGAWICAGAWVGPGVTVRTHAILGIGSVATKTLEPYGIYRGVPAVKVRTREIRPTGQVAQRSHTE
jgi:putative colanic acid biosynthesis acetyltransferase WcaF